MGAAFTPQQISAEIKLPALVGDNMVLQQQSRVRIWGHSDQKEVTITSSWSVNPEKAKTDKQGYWECWISTPSADHKSHTVSISDGKSQSQIKNILLGEVWVGGGQSNMEMPLNGFWNCPIADNNLTIAQAREYPDIRMFTVTKNAQLKETDECQGQWKESTPDNIQWWSATGYFFSRMLNQALDTPIGFINCSWGGSRVEGWLPESDCRKFPDVDYTPLTDPQKQEWLKPYVMYNGMLKPISKYTIKGWIFYQGCSNTGLDQSYAAKLKQMVERWRADWNQGELPFYFTEIAPYNYGDDNIDGAKLREAQFKAQSLIANSAMISTNDLVQEFEKDQIHPCNKQQVGQRLGFTALNRTYGMKGICCDYPTFKEMIIQEDKAVISFNNAQDGFSPWKDISGFEIAGQDKIFYPASAELDQSNKTIIVRSEKVSKPAAVRYCFKNFQIGNLHNHRNLPVIPFRTDNW